MELKEFVQETLKQILDGVAAAQESKLGDNINAAHAFAENGNLFQSQYGTFTRVDFEVAVTAESAKEGKASISVWSIGGSGGLSEKENSVSRIKFSVPLRLPDGDQNRKLKHDQAESAKWARASRRRGPAGIV
ncbi:trypco2 family protein [Ochrobactrum soli]|uniref:Uncharacterized protein n=1 Tax=Ochrobactrum soli TaxID=2448455 RepID=A0A849KPE0_9HYPH|nr:trypco2 family protein [[Ochrobactrum] soli]NNU59708.1 hypothetical protein [[Ochrobactrum] soli]